MSTEAIQYRVLLRSGLPARERELLENLTQFRVKSQSGGEDLLEFRCTQIDVSHHSYIEIETAHPNDPGEFSVLRISHHFVFLIEGNDSRPAIGFGFASPPTPSP